MIRRGHSGDSSSPPLLAQLYIGGKAFKGREREDERRVGEKMIAPLEIVSLFWGSLV